MRIDLDTLQLGPWTYRIVFVDDLKDETGEELYGQVDHEALLVQLRTGMAPQRLFQTLLHELLHVADDSFHLDLGERGVSTLEYFFAEALKYNPQLLKHARTPIPLIDP